MRFPEPRSGGGGRRAPIRIEDLHDHVDVEYPQDLDPFELIESGATNRHGYSDAVSIDTVHDGWAIPERFVENFSREEFIELDELYVTERDWGAHWAAFELAKAVGVKYCGRVTIARALLDFNRFPGSSPTHADHLGRLAINPPFSDKLNHDRKFDLLENYYDVISNGMEQMLSGCVVKIAVHTYDQRNVSGTERPPISLITRPETYQHHAIAHGSFDPLFPAVLGEFLTSRVLTYRIALALERRHIPVALNFPYLAPDGSVESRSQVWLFFSHLQHRFEAQHAYKSDEERAAFHLVWSTLMDTNLRSSAAMAFREYLHTFRRAPTGLEAFFARGRDAYVAVRQFLRAEYGDLVDGYRHAARRPSSLAVEFRKDYLWEFANERPVKLDAARGLPAIEGIAEALDEYLVQDCGFDR